MRKPGRNEQVRSAPQRVRIRLFAQGPFAHEYVSTGMIRPRPDRTMGAPHAILKYIGSTPILFTIHSSDLSIKIYRV